MVETDKGLLSGSDKLEMPGCMGLSKASRKDRVVITRAFGVKGQSLISVGKKGEGIASPARGGGGRSKSSPRGDGPLGTIQGERPRLTWRTCHGRRTVNV